MPLPENGRIISVVNADIVVVGTEHGPVLIMSNGDLNFRGQRDILVSGGCVTLRIGIPVHLNGLTMTMQEFPHQILEELGQARQEERIWPYANAEDDSYFGLDKDFIENVTEVESNLYGTVDTGTHYITTLKTHDTMVTETHDTGKILFWHC